MLLNFLNEKTYYDEWSHRALLANFVAGDSHGYILPMENFITEGEYYFKEEQGNVYSGRAWYYASIYYVFRLFLDPYSSTDLMVILQLVLECITGYVMALIIARLTGSSTAIAITLVLFCISTYQTDYTPRIINRIHFRHRH